EVSDDFLEGLALLGVANSIFERDARTANAHGAKLEASDVQNVEGDDVSLADFAKQIFCGNLTVCEDERARGRSSDTHLVFFGADREARKSFFNQKCGELFAVDFREDGEKVGKAGIGDPHLFAIQDVVLAVGRECGASTTIERVRSG